MSRRGISRIQSVHAFAMQTRPVPCFCLHRFNIQAKIISSWYFYLLVCFEHKKQFLAYFTFIVLITKNCKLCISLITRRLTFKFWLTSFWNACNLIKIRLKMLVTFKSWHEFIKAFSRHISFDHSSTAGPSKCMSYTVQ